MRLSLPAAFAGSIMLLSMGLHAADLPGKNQHATDYARSVADWRAQREKQLKADDGWLTVVGLHWLKEGANRVGSSAGVEVPLPKTAPADVGTIVVKNGSASFLPAAGARVTLNGSNAALTQEARLKPDTDEHYDTLAIGRVKFFVIKRADKLGVRVKDNDSATRREFTSLRWYPVDASWRVQAKYTPWDKPHTLTFDTAVGLPEHDESPGYVTFQRDGREYRLEPVADGGELSFVMRDATSGKTTYGASRFLDASVPQTGLKKAGVVELDFNKAYNPPCVFTAFATCPLPPPQNRLPLAVTAGEQMYGNGH